MCHQGLVLNFFYRLLSAFESFIYQSCLVILLFEQGKKVIWNLNSLAFQDAFDLAQRWELVKGLIWQIINRRNSRNFALVPNSQVSLLIQEAHSRDRLRELDLSDQLPAIVPNLNQATHIARHDQLQSVMSVNGRHFFIMLVEAIHEHARLQVLSEQLPLFQLQLFVRQTFLVFREI